MYSGLYTGVCSLNLMWAFDFNPFFFWREINEFINSSRTFFIKVGYTRSVKKKLNSKLESEHSVYPNLNSRLCFFLMEGVMYCYILVYGDNNKTVSLTRYDLFFSGRRNSVFSD